MNLPDINDLKQYGFLGPLVGTTGVALSAAGAVLFGWSRTFDDWKPTVEMLPKPLQRMISVIAAIGILYVFVHATPENKDTMLSWALWVGGIAICCFILYMGVRHHCNRYVRPVAQNGGGWVETPFWSGLWITPEARVEVKKGVTLQQYLAGRGYHKDAVWPPRSQTSTMVRKRQRVRLLTVLR